MKRGLLFVLCVLVLLPVAFGHVKYVVEDFDAHVGSDIGLLVQTFSPFNIFLMILTIVIVSALFVIIPHIPLFQREMKILKKEISDYEELIPWIARLGLGIALIGAGSNGVLVSQALPLNMFGTLQIVLGFLVLLGLFIGPATWVIIGLWIFAFFQDWYMIGNLDFLGLAIIVLLLAEGRPGVDDLTGIPFWGKLAQAKVYAARVARWSVGSAMIFLAVVEKFLNPRSSLEVVREYGLANAIPVSESMWVFSAGAVEFVVGLLLLIGWRARLVSTIAVIVLSASFFFFQEAVYSHITLFSILSVVFIYGQTKKVRLSKRRKKR